MSPAARGVHVSCQGAAAAARSIKRNTDTGRKPMLCYTRPRLTLRLLIFPRLAPSGIEGKIVALVAPSTSDR